MKIRRYGPGPAAGMPDDRGFAEALVASFTLRFTLQTVGWLRSPEPSCLAFFTNPSLEIEVLVVQAEAWIVPHPHPHPWGV